LESVANAHTAADLHVRPVSKTALVSRSWAPRTTTGIHDAARLATNLIRGASGENMLGLFGGNDMLSRLESMLLILIGDSMRAATVTFSSKNKRKVTFP
jgi:hypothetical protein